MAIEPKQVRQRIVRAPEVVALATVALTWGVLDGVSTWIVIGQGVAYEANPFVARAIGRYGLVEGLVLTNSLALSVLSVLCVVHWRVIDALERVSEPPDAAVFVARYSVPFMVAAKGVSLGVRNLSHLL